MTFSRRALLETAAKIASVPWLSATLHAAQSVSRHPTIHIAGPGEVAILWSTTAPAVRPEARYSTRSDLSGGTWVQASTMARSVLETGLPDPLFQHEVHLTGLNPGTRYYYKTFIDGVEMPPAEASPRFFEAPLSSGGFRFLALGDSGMAGEAQRAIASRMASEQNVSLVVHTGDVVYPVGSYRNYHEKYFDTYRAQMSRVPFALALGNHDVQEDLDGHICVSLNAFPVTDPPPLRGNYYSFDYGDAHFTCLDSNVFGRAEAEPMYRWLDADLTGTRKRWRIVFFHHPPYDALRGEETNAQYARERVVPILDRHSVDLVLCGHHHGYVRMYPLTAGRRVDGGRGSVYVTTGGGGADLHANSELSLAAFAASVHHYVRVDVQPTALDIRAVAADGTEIDRYTVARAPELTSRSVTNGASFAPLLAPGSIVSIFGESLGPGTRYAGRYPLPREIDGVRVTISDEEVPLFFVSPSQINAQLPMSVSGTQVLRVANAHGSAEIPIGVQETAPGIFLLGGRSETPAIVRPDGTPASASASVRAGQIVSIFATGLGRLKRPWPAGEAAPAAPLYEVEGPVAVYFGGTAVRPLFAGLAPGYAGLYQVNVQVPETSAGGVRNVWIQAAGVGSNPVFLTVE